MEWDDAEVSLFAADKNFAVVRSFRLRFARRQDDNLDGTDAGGRGGDARPASSSLSSRQIGFGQRLTISDQRRFPCSLSSNSEGFGQW